MEVLSEPVLQITKDPQESWARCLLADLCDAVTDGDVKAWVALDPRTSLNLVFDEIPSMELSSPLQTHPTLLLHVQGLPNRHSQSSQ